MTATLPLSRILPVARLTSGGETMRIIADETQRPAIAAAYDLPAMRHFVADFLILPEGKAGAALRGSIDAEFDQTCIVTLEPFPVSLRVPVAMHFAPASTLTSDDVAELELDLESAEPPEPIENGEIDLGAVACEFFALSLEPYPRKPGAVFELPAEIGKTENPFAVLARLKDG